ncbi:MAG: ribosome maturation factor RimP [Deinococcus sp.]|nr:ribosome maturation factor RimP [Deinococcus sp.]
MEMQKVAEAVLVPLGYEVLEASLRGAGKARVLTVRIDRQDEAPVSVADLQRASRVLSLELDRLDPVPGSYRLEVESPGADRPLFTQRHFERFAGLKAKVKGPERNFTGKIGKVENQEVEFTLENKEELRLKIGTFKANLAEWPKEHR